MLTIADLKAAIADLPDDVPVALSYLERDSWHDWMDLEAVTAAERWTRPLGRDVFVIN